MSQENITTEVEAKYWAPSIDVSDYPKSKDIEQGYFDLNNLDPSVKEFFLSKFTDINLDKYVEARLRNKGGKYFLTLKGDGTLERPEAEEEISEDEFTQFWPQTSAGNVQKTRHEKTLVEGKLKDGGLTLETDVYREKLTGLFSAEIEYNPNLYTPEEIDQKIQEQIPGAINVTNVKALKNKRLAAYKNMDELREALLEDKEAVAIFSRGEIEKLFDA